MKINYKNTALGFLDGSRPIEFYLAEPSTPMTEEKKKIFGHSVRTALQRDSDLFKDNIRYISEPFFNAFIKSKSKLSKVFDKEDMDESGTFVWAKGSFTTTVFYALITTGSGDEWNIKLIYLMFSKHSQNDMFGLDACILMNDEEQTFQSFVWKGHVENKYDDYWWMGHLIGLLTFIKYCEIETKIIPAGKKSHHVGTKYLNETKQSIEILDSTWFTTVISSNGFSVGKDTGGFFRWQPCGPGLVKRKLLWILPFEKEGYTRTAKVENERLNK